MAGERPNWTNRTQAELIAALRRNGIINGAA